jgi:hypothetical protein
VTGAIFLLPCQISFLNDDNYEAYDLLRCYAV